MSETFQSIIDFETSICTQSALYIFHAFEREMKSCCPQYDEDGDLYEDDLFWFGYITAYWCIEKNITGKDIVDKINIDGMLDNYEILHTISVKSAIKKIEEE